MNSPWAVALLLVLCALSGGQATPAADAIRIAAEVDTVKTARYWGVDPTHGDRKVFSRLEVYPAEAKALHLAVTVTAGRAVEAGDSLVLRVRDMFADSTTTLRRAVPAAIPAGEQATWPLELTRDELPFADGAYHILIDIEREDASLASPDVGSVLYLLADRKRSLGYVSATYAIAFAYFMRDPETGSTINMFPAPGRLPSTFDPQEPETRQAWLGEMMKPMLAADKESWRKAAEDAMHRDANISAELVADGGTGILFGMMAYRAMGDKDRERFAFKVLDGFVNERIRKGKSTPHVNQSWHVVRMLSYAVILLRDIPEYREWVDKTLDEIIPLQLKDTITYDPAVGGNARGPIPTFSHKTIVVDGKKLQREPYCDGTYVGRVYGGHAWYQFAHLLLRGTEAPTLAEPVDRIIEFAAAESQWLVDTQSTTRGFYGNMPGSYNLCFGLIPAYHLAQRAGRPEDAAGIARGIRTALLCAIDEPDYGPHFEGWFDADGYTLCEMAIRILGEDPEVRQAQRRFSNDADPDITVPGQAARNEPYGMGHRLATIAPMLLCSPEYRAAIAAGAGSWVDRLPPE